MDFEWDSEKARDNEIKHGVSFVEASEIYDDDYSSCVRDPEHSRDEDRYLIFGKSHQGILLYPMPNEQRLYVSYPQDL